MGPPWMTGLILDAWHQQAHILRDSDLIVGTLRRFTVALARSSGALDLRLARLACHAQQLDLRPLGYGSFTAFVREELDWQPSRQRTMARLLRSDLDLIKRSVTMGIIPISIAVQAPGRVLAEQQADWLLRAVDRGQALQEGTAPTPWPASPPHRVRVAGPDASTIRRARELCRLLLGYRAPDCVCDRTIMRAHTEPGALQQLINDALTPPDRPPLPPACWPDDGYDPAASLLGPWEQPRDLSHTLALVRDVQQLRRLRRAALGQVLSQIRDTAAYVGWGFCSLHDFVQADLDLSLRHAQRLIRLGARLHVDPVLAGAVIQGLSVSRAGALDRLTRTQTQLRQWLKLAERLPRRELEDASRNPNGGAPSATRARALAAHYQANLNRAPALVTQAMAQHEARSTAASATESGGPRLGTDQPDSIRVARHPDDPDKTARRAIAGMWVLPGLLQASRCFLDAARPPRQRGYGRIKDAQFFICQNPECHRRCLRNHAHHDQPQALGGSDKPDNLRCLCPSCHLRLLHGGFMAVERVGDAHVYLFPGRAVVVR